MTTATVRLDAQSWHLVQPRPVLPTLLFDVNLNMSHTALQHGFGNSLTLAAKAVAVNMSQYSSMAGRLEARLHQKAVVVIMSAPIIAVALLL